MIAKLWGKKAVNLLLSLILVCGLLPAVPGQALAVQRDETKDQVHVVVENTTSPKSEDIAWDGVLVDTWVDINATSTMMSAVVAALTEVGATQEGAENNYISEINGLAAMDGGDESGWMGTLNDWFTNYGFAMFTVKDGTLGANDEIRVMYTTNGYGEDLGSSFYNNTTTVKALTFSAGTLDKAFSAEDKEYTLTVPAGTTSLMVTPTATNKNFQVRTSVGETTYKRTQSVPVQNGTVITVKCGDPSWPSMNSSDGATTYTITVVEAAAPQVSFGVTMEDGTAIPATGVEFTYGDGAPYLKAVQTQGESASIAYKWQSAESENGEWEDAGTAKNRKKQSFRVSEVVGVMWYRCVITADEQTYIAGPVKVTVAGKDYTQAEVDALAAAFYDMTPALDEPEEAIMQGDTEAMLVPSVNPYSDALDDPYVVTYDWYMSTDNGATWALAGDTGSGEYSEILPMAKYLNKLAAGTYQFKMIATISVQNLAGQTLSATAETNAVTVEIVAKEIKFEGAGTQEDPYLLRNAAELTQLSKNVAEGEAYSGKYFKMTADITLPADWAPIGTSSKRFKGNIDGDNHLLTVPVDGLPLLGCTEFASVSNLNIYGERIAGYGLVNIYATGSHNACITIKNVTLKEGSSTLKSGFIGGYASGDHSITIEDCTIEKGVVIGYDGAQSNIGSFAGEFNGTIKNCASYATVKGVNFVGGIIGDKGQSMGTCTMESCTFAGSVEATGNYAGGILGAGYGGTSWGMASAPNSPCPSIIKCTMSGSVTGVGRVGGILGGEGAVYQCWENGIGTISGNVVTGAVSGQSETGAVIGFIAGLNKCNIIENNTYVYGSAATGIGRMEWVDTSCENPAVVEGTTYLNSSVALPDFKAGTGPWDPQCFSKSNLNRTDDPLGADAETLTRMVMPSYDAVATVEGSQTVKVDDIITVNVTVTSSNTLAAMEAELSYDATELELVSVEKGAGLSDDASFMPAEGKAEALFSFCANEASASDGLVVATATFKALKASEGASITLKDGALASGSVQSLDFDVTVGQAASVKVLANALLGDASNNGKINIVDAQCVYDLATSKYGTDYAQYPLPAEWTLSTLLWVANVNGDDAVDAADAFAIQHYVHTGAFA